ncbi:MAG TPA: M48 family peptidase, partial [Blastocatellia bacterium]|nr:M48 family peptidase [Blastocatellia bacterium]
MRALFLIIGLCLLFTPAASAQQPAATPDAPQNSAQSSSSQTGDSQAGAPVPVPEPSEKALSYYRSGIV